MADSTRADRMFAVDQAIKAGDLSKKDEILDFITAGESPSPNSITGFHSPH